MALSFEEEKKRLDAFRRVAGLSDADYEMRLAKLRTRHGGAAQPRAADNSPRAREPDRRERPAAEVARPPSARGFDEDTRKKAIAPYRFVEIADAVAKPPQPVEEAIAHRKILSTPLPEGYCGEISVTFEAETPLLIGEEIDVTENGSQRTAVVPLSAGGHGDGPWWVPGASLRGMIRAACEIVGYARLESANRHHVFSLRDFEHPYYNDTTGASGGPALGKQGAIKAGWLWKEQEQYFIQPSDLALIEIADLLPFAGGRVGTVEEWTKLELTAKYSALKMRRGKAIDFKKSFNIKFRLSGVDQQKRTRVKPDRSGHQDGVVVVANKAPGNASADKRKKFEYVFLTLPGQRDNQRKCLSKEAFEKFELVHTSPGRKAQEPSGSWAPLKPIVERGDPVPVFYTGDLDAQEKPDFAFGLTRLFKIAHRNSVGAMIDRTDAHKPHLGAGRYEPDMVSALFGYVQEPKEFGRDADAKSDDLALKSRLAFSGATIGPDAAEVGPRDRYIETVMGPPRASFAPYSLVGEVKVWSDESGTTRIAGRRRYGPRGVAADGAVKPGMGDIGAALRGQIDRLSGEAKNNMKTRSLLKFLIGRGGKPFTFSSRIALHNVAAEEIGLLLSSLMHNGDPDCRHMLGRAKAFGAGQLRVAKATLRLTANRDEGAALVGGNREADDAAHAPFLAAFIAHMRNPQNYWGGDAAAQQISQTRLRSGNFSPSPIPRK